MLKRTMIMMGAGLLLLGSPAMAQNNPDVDQLRAKVRADVRAAALTRLTAALALDAPTVAKLSATLNRYGDQMQALRQDSRNARRELHTLLQSGQADNNRVNHLANVLLTNRDRIHRLTDDRTKDVRRVLSPQQFGKLLMAWPRINREMRMEMFRAIRGQGGGPMGPGRWGGHGGWRGQGPAAAPGQPGAVGTLKGPGPDAEAQFAEAAMDEGEEW